MSTPLEVSSPVDAVLFDYGLVLTGPPHPPAWEQMKSLLQADESRFHTAYWRTRPDYDRGALDGRNYWLTVGKDLGQVVSEETMERLLEADTALWTQPNEQMIAWAAALQAAGVRTGILSNLGDAMEMGVRERCPWLIGFDHMTFSHRLGMAKPDPVIYRHAAEGLGVEPARVLFVDDREDNIEAARAVGMHAIQYTNHAAFAEAMRQAGLGGLLEHATKVEAL